MVGKTDYELTLQRANHWVVNCSRCHRVAWADVVGADTGAWRCFECNNWFCWNCAKEHFKDTGVKVNV